VLQEMQEVAIGLFGILQKREVTDCRLQQQYCTENLVGHEQRVLRLIASS